MQISNQKVILITGASRGIGAATALLAAEKGYKVCINYRSNASAAESLLQQIKNQGGQAIAVQADVSIESEVLRLFTELDATWGQIDVLVNNVGILEKKMDVKAMSAERIERCLRTNILSAFLCAKEAIKRMSTQTGGQGGAIVNVSSRAACIGSAHEYVDYAASKGAIDTFTLGLAREVAAEGIRVNAVRPGFIFTEIHADAGEPNRVQRLEASLPMQRGGQPEEVAAAILWLASKEASYVTGGFIDVAGGR